MKPSIGRSILAVVAGLLIAAALSIATDAMMHATGVFPEGPDMSNARYALATAYRCAFQLLGGFLTARLAPVRPMQHVWILAGSGQVLSLLGIVAWSVVGGPLWYPLALVVTAIPSVWIGGWIQQRLSKAEEHFGYGLPGFKLDSHPLIYMGAAKNHCALYGALPAGFSERLKGFTVSKGTIQFTPEKPIPATLVKAIVKAKVVENRLRWPVNVAKKATSKTTKK